MLEDYEDTGKLFQKSQAAKDALAKQQGAQRQQLVEQQKEQRAKEQQEQEKFWNRHKLLFICHQTITKVLHLFYSIKGQ